MDYCQHPYLYRRRPSRVVHVGDVALGGREPVRIQSMTTPATSDIAATLDQMERLADAGCEIVRVTVPTVADADHLGKIRAEMRRRRIAMSLVADIHFNPAAALAAVEHADKVRINPGNFVDSKRFEQREYTDAEYAAELARIGERFLPLVDRARELGVAIRVGTNHGSLSDRILNRFGDTPAGMAESALEFLRVARDRGFHDLVLSMKSSNPLVMIQAYRLLAERMDGRRAWTIRSIWASPRRARARTAGSSRRWVSARCWRTGSVTPSASPSRRIPWQEIPAGPGVGWPSTNELRQGAPLNARWISRYRSCVIRIATPVGLPRPRSSCRVVEWGGEAAAAAWR